MSKTLRDDDDDDDDLPGGVEEEKEDETRDSLYFSSREYDDCEDADEEEDEDAYRLRVYGTTDYENKDPQTPEEEDGGGGDTFRRLSKRVSSEIVRRKSSVVEQLPDTPQGWTVFLSAIGAAVLGYEMNLQYSLTKPPITFGQFPKRSVMENVYRKMTATDNSILSRTIQPSLFVGTRGLLASTAAYMLGGPTTEGEHLCFREVFTSTQDGAAFAVDWETPLFANGQKLPPEQRKERILNGPIYNPVIIILHGINNDSSFGYIRSMKRIFADRGWNAAAMNFRGCGGVPLTTPRGYNGSYTGDLRNLVLQISTRLSKDVPVFIIGNSLGANVITKYFGEEGRSGTLPPCVAGGASLANPLVINSSVICFPFNIFMALGVKKYYLENLSSFKQMKDANFQHSLINGFLATTIANLDRSLARYILHNETTYPYSQIIGYESGDAYWMDASSYRYVRDISVPFLNLASEDDFLISKPSRNRLGFCIGNPNIMVVETRCGGHLGWQESPPDTDSAFGSTSWADSAAADFFESVMKANMEKYGSRTGRHQHLGQDPEEVNEKVQMLLTGGTVSSNLRAKL